MSLFQQGHALVIGVGDYADPALKLPQPIPVAEACEVVWALRDADIAGYPENQVQRVGDDNRPATRLEVVKSLTDLAARVTEEDTVFLFYCGHGVMGEDGVYYLTTKDTELTPDRKVKKDTGLSHTSLMTLLGRVKAKKLLFVLNACFSGHVQPTLGAGKALRRGAFRRPPLQDPQRR